MKIRRILAGLFVLLDRSSKQTSTLVWALLADHMSSCRPSWLRYSTVSRTDMLCNKLVSPGLCTRTMNTTIRTRMCQTRRNFYCTHCHLPEQFPNTHLHIPSRCPLQHNTVFHHCSSRLSYHLTFVLPPSHRHTASHSGRLCGSYNPAAHIGLHSCINTFDPLTRYTLTY